MASPPRLHGPIAKPLEFRELSEDVKRLREAQRKHDELLEQVLRPAVAAHVTACRGALEWAKAQHLRVVEVTDLDPASHTIAAAIWLLAGRCLGLLEALWIQVEGGIDNEALITGRAIHEATQVLFVMTDPESEAQVRVWLADEGKYGYVTASAARKAQEAFDVRLAAAMKEMGAEPLDSQAARAISADLYDRMSRTAHNRRSSCLNSYWTDGREMAYGVHDSPLRRAGATAWGQTMTVEVVQVVGDALGQFYEQGFYFRAVQPVVEGLAEVEANAPINERTMNALAQLTTAEVATLVATPNE